MSASSTTFPEAKEAIAQLFSDVWTPTGLGFALDNEKFDPPENAGWARMVVRHNASTQSTLGNRQNRKFDRFGAAFIQVFSAQRVGSNPTDGNVQLVLDGFEGARIPDTTICFLDVIPREVGPSDKWFQVTIEAQFRYTEVK